LKSIETFGFNVPILVDVERKVIAGHGRLLGAQKLGLSVVPTIQLDHLTEAQSRAFMIADNRLTENSAWDDRLLAEQLKELSELELDFSLETTGFAMGEIDLRIEGLTVPAETEDDPADTLPSPSPARTRPGDLWQLGPHRLLCGDARDDAAYARLMAGKLAAMVFTDPPYNVPIDGNVCGLGAIRHRPFAMASGEMDEAKFTSFLTQACSLLAHHSADGSLHYVCMDWRHLPELLAAGRAAYAELKNLCVWAKNNAGMGSLYRSQHELVLVFKSGNGRHRNNVELGRHGRHRTNVWHYPSVSAFARANDEGTLLAMHPTVKPVRLVADAILDASARGDIILDPFAGSGTTLIAAERTGRRCFLMEIDPKHADTIVHRWEAFTGGKAKRRPYNEAATPDIADSTDAG
jgi:DNA modification methylase